MKPPDPLQKNERIVSYTADEIDEDLIDWFKARGPWYQPRINAVLRSYVDAHRD